ncbi:MAG: YdbL family protein [Blastochloris sp.]|nr:YdbL family protein [Blastochloris sp.]
MKVEVTTKNEPGTTATTAAANQEASPRLRQRNRITEIQSLKNDRIVGEAKNGLLVIKKLPIDPAYQEYSKKLVEAENADRGQIYQIEADAQNKPLSFIIAEYARRLRESAFPGEWVEQEDGTWINR